MDLRLDSLENFWATNTLVEIDWSWYQQIYLLETLLVRISNIYSNRD